MKKWFAALFMGLILLSAVPLNVFAAESGSVTTLAALKEALSSADTSVVRLAGNVDCEGETLEITRGLTLSGGNYTLSNASLSIKDTQDPVILENITLDAGLTQGDAVSAENTFQLSMTNVQILSAAENGFRADGVSSLTMSGCTVRDSGAYALYFNEVIGELSSLTTGGNALGVACLRENCQVVVSGSPIHEDLVADAEAVAAIREGEFDKNISPNDELAIIFRFAVSENSIVAWNASNSNIRYIRKTVVLEGTEYQYIIIPYDDEAPMIMLVNKPDAVLGDSIAVADYFTVSDNRAGDIRLEYTVRSPQGEAVSLAEGTFVADSVGEYEILLESGDSYGNNYSRRYYLSVVNEDTVRPVITNYALQLNYTVGDYLTLPTFVASDDRVENIACTVQVFSPSGENIAYAGGIRLTDVGVYRVRVSASDGVNESDLVYRLTVSAAAGATAGGNVLSPVAIGWIAAAAVFVVLAAGIVAVKFVFRSRKNKIKEDSSAR